MAPNILVVEDNVITRKMMRLALESAGYGVFEAADGKTAVGAATKNHPALILQDLLLPDIDGLELVKELRKALTDRNVPILACTGLMSKLDEALPTIQTDGGKLKHIVQNLINNAIKFAHEGSVTVTARVTGIREQGPGVSEAGAEPRPPISDPRFAEFRVSDTGIDISKEKLPTIFEKFYQADSSETRLFGGAGFGLHIVKRFTDLLGGKIEVESEPGTGTTFIVKIPLEN